MGSVLDLVLPCTPHLQNFYGPSGRVLRQILADGAEYRFRYQLSGAIRSGPGCLVVSPGTAVPYRTVLVGAAPCPTVDSWENLQAGFTITGGTVTATTVVDPRQQATTTRFNQRGYPLGSTDALGQTSTTVYNAANQAVSTTDALGRVTTFEYDTAGNVKKIIDPNTQPTQFEYHATWNKVTKITDALSQITEFTYDNANGNLLTVKDPLNHVTTIAYNAFGQPTSVQGPILTEPPTTFAYDTNGNLITTTDPLGNATQRSYDAVSRLTSLTDPRGLQTQFRYDGLNQVTEIADARQELTRFSYDRNGNLLSVTDAKNQGTTYTYDSMDRLSTRQDALGRSESYQYDLAGNLTEFTDRKNQVTTFQYDSLDRQKLTVVKSPEDVVTATLAKQLSRFGPVQKREFADFREALEYILPIKSFVTRYLTVQIGEWSLLTCDMRLSDCDSHVISLSQNLKCAAISAVGHNRGRQFNYFVDGSARRIIHCYEDGSRWVFFQEGTPLECEQVSTYTLRRKPDRFKPEHVWQCMNYITGMTFPINWVELRNRPATTLERSLQDLKVSVQLYKTKKDVIL